MWAGNRFCCTYFEHSGLLARCACVHRAPHHVAQSPGGLLRLHEAAQARLGFECLPGVLQRLQLGVRRALETAQGRRHALGGGRARLGAGRRHVAVQRPVQGIEAALLRGGDLRAAGGPQVLGALAQQGGPQGQGGQAQQQGGQAEFGTQAQATGPAQGLNRRGLNRRNGPCRQNPGPSVRRYRG